ncbi:hypothetical protein QTP86_017275 [Hemibagrus guttatus]|nr:hypothetical protein QTP86_017275 [Hemibagrus guttatus]
MEQNMLQMLNPQKLESLEKWLEETNTTLTQINGQRRYGGPPPGWRGPVPGPGCEVFISQIPRDMFEDQLIPLFQSIVPLYEFRLMMNFSGQNRGFAYAKYGDTANAAATIQALNLYPLPSGVRLTVKRSTEKRQLCLGDLPLAMGRSELLSVLRQITDGVEGITMKTTGPIEVTAFVHYSSHYAASMAKKVLLQGKESRTEAIRDKNIYQMKYPSSLKCHFKFSTRLIQFRTRLIPFRTRLIPFRTRLIPFRTRLIPFRTRLIPFRTRLIPFRTRLIPFRTRLIPFRTRLIPFRTRLIPFRTRLIPFRTRLIPFRTRLIPFRTRLIPFRTRLIPFRTRLIPFRTRLIPFRTRLIPFRTRLIPFRTRLIPFRTRLIPFRTRLIPFRTRLIPFAFRKLYGISISIRWMSGSGKSRREGHDEKRLLVPSRLNALTPPRFKLSRDPEHPPPLPTPPSTFHPQSFTRAVGGPTPQVMSVMLPAKPRGGVEEPLYDLVLQLRWLCEQHGLGVPIYNMRYDHTGPDGFLYFSYRVVVPGLAVPFCGVAHVLPSTCGNMEAEVQRAAAKQVFGALWKARNL